MTERVKTLRYVGAALLLAALAVLSAPRRPAPAALQDRGEPLFPEFKDPASATTLEVVEMDEATATARPFKVTNQKGLWTIPSHNNYPADGKDRLAKTAAAVIGLKKGDFRTDNPADYEACGVVDPLDTKAASSKGHGKRITIKGAGDQVLADVIVGKAVPEREGFNFVRLPQGKRVWAARLDAEISTRFEDWIERDLLLVDREAIDEVTLEDYSIDERTGMITTRDRVVLAKKDGKWEMDRLPAGQDIDQYKIDTLLTAIDGLNIVGVRKKPAGLSESLKRLEGGLTITQADMASLGSRGYYFARDGRLLSNEGELRVRTKEGILYTLRFGEVAYGRGDAISAGTADEGPAGGAPGENRYLFITTALSSAAGPAGETDEQRKQRQENAGKAAAKLNARFADWYYVISSESFDKVHLRRQDLLRKKA